MPAAYLKAPATSAYRGLGCGKIPFNTRREAERAKRNMRPAAPELAAVGAGQLSSYSCITCGYWHLGHRTGGERRE